MAASADDVKREAMRELARRELARRRQSGSQPESASQGFLRGVRNSATDLYRGAAGLVSLPFDTLSNVQNAVTSRLYPEGYDVTINGQKQHRTGLVPTMTEQREQALSATGLTPRYGSGFEEAVGAGTRAMGAALPSLGAGSILSGAASPVASGVGRSLAAAPVTQLVSSASGGASSDVARQMGAGPVGQFAAGVAGAAVPVAASAISQRMARDPNLLTSDQLKDVARSKFEQVKQQGIEFQPQEVKDLGVQMGGVLREHGITSQRITDKLFPKVGAVTDEMALAINSGQPMAFDDLINIRQLLKVAAGSADRQERAVAMQLTDKLDDLVGASTSLPAQARDIWRRASNAEMVDRLAQRAEDSASQFGASGFENAIRTQFRAFIKNDKAMRMLKPAERDAMRRVAEGTFGGNVARGMGRFAPRGPVSVGANVLIGSSPVGALGLAGAGEAGRQLATAATVRNINLARDTMLRGGSAIKPPVAIIWPVYGPAAALTTEQERKRQALAAALRSQDR